MKRTAEDKTTARLEATLKTVKTEADIRRYVQENTQGTYGSFKEYFDAYIAEHEIPLKEIRKRCGISSNYFYNVVNADRNPKRDKIIALCVAAEMNYEETKKALRLAGAGDLNPKNERDSYIAMGINSRMGNVLKLNLFLDENGQEPLK